MGILARNIAKHLREFYFGKNWTASSLKDHIQDVSCDMAQTRFQSFHTIAELVYHIHYYSVVAGPVLEGNELDADDAVSFNAPTFQGQQEWEGYLAQIYQEAEQFASLIEAIPDAQFDDQFFDKKWGSTYRNIQGIVEHGHYHLGQIVMLKKILSEQEES